MSQQVTQLHPTAATLADGRSLPPPVACPAPLRYSARGILLRFRAWCRDWFEILDYRTALAYCLDIDGSLVPTRERSDDA